MSTTIIDTHSGWRILALSSDLAEALGNPPGSAGKGKPELTEALLAEGIPEGPSHPSAVGGSAAGDAEQRRAGVSQPTF